MSVKEQLGLEDPDRGLLRQARARWVEWAAAEPALSGSDSLSWPHHDGLGWLHLVGVSGGVTV